MDDGLEIITQNPGQAFPIAPSSKQSELALNYPYNCWWVAALSDEVGRSLLSRWLLELPILLYRRQDGTVAAIEDRCPHRSAPLSIGTLRGDNVVCGYHGFEFASDGKCVRVPTQANPGRIKARSYPVIEQYPFVWIYTGDLERIDSVPKPMESVSWGVDPDVVVVHGYTSISANYMLLKENVLDLSHVPVVHCKSLEMDQIPPSQFSTQGDLVSYIGQVEHGPLQFLYAEGSEIDQDKEMDQIFHGKFESPALQTSTSDITDHDAGPDGRKNYYFHICHATTPIDMKSMHYWWAAGRDYGRSDPEFKLKYAAIINAAFEEDKTILEAIQQTVNRSPTKTEFSVGADAGPIAARRSLQRWMAREI